VARGGNGLNYIEIVRRGNRSRGEGSGRFFEKKLRKKLLLWGSGALEPRERKFFAELRAAMTERLRGLNRATQLWFKKRPLTF